MFKFQIAEDLIKGNESIRLKLYECSAKKLSIGWGRNIDDNGISIHEANFMFSNDFNETFEDLLGIFPEFLKYPEGPQYALLDMRFNLGPNRFREFKKMIDAVIRENWSEAEYELMNSRYANQVLNRALKNGDLMGGLAP